MGRAAKTTEDSASETTVQAGPIVEEVGQALLVITHGPERGRLIVLPASKEPARIGRAPSCEVVIDDPSLSRVHATIRCVLGEHYVRDEGSRNGTLRNGSAVDFASPLTDGDRLTLGNVRLRFTRGGDGEPRLLTSQPAGVVSRGGAAVRRVAMTPALRGVFDQAERAAKSSLSVLILGETGAGKEILAETIHESSPRANKELLSINCAALTESLLEAELFGHERGAFTGAVSARPGLLEAADGGTLFLDEVGELPLATQAKLLRVLEDKRVLRVGARSHKSVDVRFIAATNQNLERRVADGSFRRDLFFRLNAITLTLPPLRARKEDILVLAQTFLDEANAVAGGPARTLSEEAKQALLRHTWPGNARELRNAIERAVVLSTSSVIPRSALPPSVLEPTAAPASTPGREPVPSSRRPVLSDAVEHAERERILAVLEEQGGNQTAAAEALGISRRTLVSRLSDWGLTKPKRRR